MKTYITQIAFDITALNIEEPTVVIVATNAKESIDEMENLLYSQGYHDQPDGQYFIDDIPEHIGKQLTLHGPGAVVGYLLAKLAEVVDSATNYKVEAMCFPESKEISYVILPGNAKSFVCKNKKFTRTFDGENVECYFKSFPTFWEAIQEDHLAQVNARSIINELNVAQVNARSSVNGLNVSYQLSIICKNATDQKMSEYYTYNS